MAKKIKNYSSRLSKEALDILFYEKLDYDFLYHKAHVLKLSLDEWSKFKDLEKQHSFEYLEGDQVDDKRKQAIGAELFFTSIHLVETLIALLLAPFQPLPDWLYLTTYQTKDIIEAAKKYLDDDLHGFAGITAKSSREFLVQSLMIAASESSEVFESVVTDHHKFICMAAHRYLQNAEYGGVYGAYKHGTRIHGGGFEIQVGTDEKLNPLLSSNFGVSWLAVREVSNDEKSKNYELDLHFKGISPEASFNYIIILSHVIRTLQQTRLSSLRGHPVTVRMGNIDFDILNDPVSFQQITYHI